MSDLNILIGALIFMSFASSCENDIEAEVYFSTSVASHIIAHRGYWTLDGVEQNSTLSIKKALELPIAGIEVDVRQTKDSVFVLSHDDMVDNASIRNSSYKDIEGLHLCRLEDALMILKMHPGHKILIEIKECDVNLLFNYVISYLPSSQVEFISFNRTYCEKIAANNLGYKVLYLNGDMMSDELKSSQFNGADYHYSIFMENPDLIDSLKDNGLMAYCWTLSNRSEIEYFLSKGIDFVTVDIPKNFNIIPELYE